MAPTFDASGISGRCEADLAVLVLDVELERREAVALQIEVLVELARQRREAHRDVDPRISTGSARAPTDCVAATGRALDRLGRAAARAHELCADAQERDPREDRTDRGPTPEALPAPRRSPTLAKPLVRVDGWEEHRHRGVDLIAVSARLPAEQPRSM